MSTSVGAIDLGLSINKNNFGRELNGIGKYAAGQAKSAFSSVGKVLGSIIAVGSVVAFTKSCIELGSDLAEVQNVVDVTFGRMSNDINSFAKNAITQFGLSETSAKQYSSTMGAMLKSMGFTTKSALEMSKSITGLSADMASFYNLDNQTAFEKIRSGISGETEPLKQLGINMSVANLEAYALSKGIKTAYSAMSQQQQALLRYNYLMSVTADAQGDFARTSGGWANQTRILRENFNSLKAELGQAFIAVATPMLSMLNSIITKLQQAAAAFRSFINAVTGNDSVNTGSMTEDMSATAAAAGAADAAVAGIGKSAEKTKKALMGIDEINILSLDESTDISAENMMPVTDTGINTKAIKASMTGIEGEINRTLDNIKKRYNELAALFKKGFNIGIGGEYKSKLSDIKSSVAGIKSSLKDIFNDPKIRTAADSLSRNFITSFGSVSGAGVSVGTNIARNIVGGWNRYLESNKGFISERITGILGNTEDFYLQAGELAAATAEIFDVFGGETGQQITANIIGVFNNGFLGALDLGTRFGTDLFWAITQPIIDNKDEIKLAIENTLKPIETITATIKKSVDDTFISAKKTYDENISPMFSNFEEGTSRMAGAILSWYNEDMAPVLQDWAKDWSKMYTESVQPNVDECIKIVGKFGEAISLVWKNVITPFVEWFINTFGPDIANNTDKAGNSIIDFAGKANTNLGKVLDSFNKIMDAIILLLESLGNFKENWSTGMDEIVAGLKGDAIRNTLKQLGSDIKQISKNIVNGIIDNINWLINKANEKIRFEMPEFLGGEKFGGFNIPTIPKLAQGGIVKQPTLAMVGEAGREAVMPLENNTGWIDELAARIAMLIMSQANNGGSHYDNTPIEIIIEIGGVKFGKVVLDSLNALKKQNGRLRLEL